ELRVASQRGSSDDLTVVVEIVGEGAGASEAADVLHSVFSVPEEGTGGYGEGGGANRAWNRIGIRPPNDLSPLVDQPRHGVGAGAQSAQILHHSVLPVSCPRLIPVTEHRIGIWNRVVGLPDDLAAAVDGVGPTVVPTCQGPQIGHLPVLRKHSVDLRKRRVQWILLAVVGDSRH